MAVVMTEVVMAMVVEMVVIVLGPMEVCQEPSRS